MHSLSHDSSLTVASTSLSKSSTSTAEINRGLGKRWMEIQGFNNWEGMLDPLDENLRQEILRYGKFVEAAYRAFDFDPSSPTYATCKFPRKSLLDRSGVGESGYRITKNLRATCGINLPRWLESSPRWANTLSSWIGYVAVCQDKDEIARLGRRDVVIAFRGTGTCMEWIENLRATLTDFPGDDEAPTGMVESGFLSLYTSGTATCPSLRDMVREEVAKVVETYGDEPLSFTVTGHSLGAALATLTASDINAVCGGETALVTVVSFGGPRVGNTRFRRQLEKSGTRVLRIVNSDDVITKVPGFVIDNNDVACHVGGLPTWLEKMQWDYADLGRELRLSSKQSPFLRKTGVATCHELGTYLHLVNGFVSSTCPFRTTAEMMLRDQHMMKLRKLQKLGVN
ncbi:PREDICTED: phospholipase A(1) DAD1, chloroplastic-like [Tarenaya hassleriana]|uniref:phospholipase A(1) DAD1, chloroplastic-like n=1 Tax=Tarenaya hassleriana TaxID=28532 RepID=UPI0008FD3540|nr:PREDICTED: phospholipase A(1) DAD1, chloroplastic-like [Tarenaya hassleriana]